MFVRWLLLVCGWPVGCVLLVACWLFCGVSCWMCVVCCKLVVVFHGLPLVVCCLWCSVCGVPCVVCCVRFVRRCVLFDVCHFMHVFCCVGVCCLWFVVGCLVVCCFVACCLLFMTIVCCLFVVRCALFAVRCLLPVVYW